MSINLKSRIAKLEGVIPLSPTERFFKHIVNITGGTETFQRMLDYTKKYMGYLQESKESCEQSSESDFIRFDPPEDLKGYFIQWGRANDFPFDQLMNRSN